MFYRGALPGPAGHVPPVLIMPAVYTLCTVTGSDRFEGPAEGRRLVSIFPLSGGRCGQLRAGHRSVNQCRLAPPESALSGRNGSWELWLKKRAFLGSERKRRLLHTFSRQKMIPECTIFAYGKIVLFSGKRALLARQFRRPHSSLPAKADKSRQKLSKDTF